MEKIKESFQRVKKDIDSLYAQLSSFREEIRETREEMLKICKILEQTLEKIAESPKFISQIPVSSVSLPTHPPLTSTTPIPTPTHKYSSEAPKPPLKPQKIPVSTGNEGVPTDRQTNQQTDIQHIISLKTEESEQNSIDHAAKMLDSLDSIKKEIRLKFKQLTDQEILVFSILYQIDEETGPTNYKILAQKLNLTESSIRDYIGKLIKKGIPVDKKRINNKIILLSVSPNLKKIASLSTILQLRDL
jgi:DNA-binding MarR family transcriptional regulator